jgi:hypothetical protein
MGALGFHKLKDGSPDGPLFDSTLQTSIGALKGCGGLAADFQVPGSVTRGAMTDWACDVYHDLAGCRSQSGLWQILCNSLPQDSKGRVCPEDGRQKERQ